MDVLYEEKKLESNLKLEKEAQNLALFKERIERSKQITNSMGNILSSFENRLAKLEDSIVPIYNETGNLQRRQSNIDHTLTYLDHVIGFYSICTDVESIIRSGPAGPKGLDTFLSTMSKLNQAQNYFEKNNPQSVELENVNTLFNAGVDSLNREFRDLLLKHSKPVQPVTLLDLITADDDLGSMDASSNSTSMNDTNDSCSITSLNLNFPETVSSDLNKMADWLINHSRDEFMNVYAKMRSSVLVKCLQLLKQHHKSNSGASMQGGSSSPQPRVKFPNRHHDSSNSKTKRVQIMFERKANKMLLKASQTFEHSTGFTLGSRKGSLFENRDDDVVDEQEMENYLVTVMALQKLMLNEKQLMSGIIIEKHRSQIFKMIIQDALKMIIQEDGESIAAKAKRCIARHDFQAVLVIFPILKHLYIMKPDFERTVEGCDLNIRNQFSNILNTLHTTGAKALEDFIDSIRTDSSSSLPPDGTVHQITSDVLVFVEQLLEYTDTIGGVLEQDVAYTNSLGQEPPHKPTDKQKYLLAIYIKKILSQLNLTLISKSELYSEHGVKCLFRVNNFNYILKALQRSTPLMSIVSSCENTYYEMINTHKNAYQLCWSRVVSFVTGMDPDIMIVGGKMKDKDKNSLKERFSGFNKEVEEISRTQRGYSIPDVELRESIKRDNKEYILPKYNAFYDRYSQLPFTKSPEKYVKYTPEQIAALLDRFFDVAA